MKAETNFKISVISPNYNYGHFIGKMLESVVNQDYDNIEHIIVDDGSSDNSIEIISGFVTKYPQKFKLITQANSGQTNAINKALRQVTGDIICWINSDDFFCENVFGKIVKLFHCNPCVDAIYGNINIINEDGEIIKVNKYLNFSYISGVFNGFGRVISSNAIFWKKSLTDEIGLMNEDYTYAMDSEYWSRLLYKRKLIKTDLIIASFRWHPKAKTILRKKKQNSDYDLANHENLMIRQHSYNNLLISKLLPFKYSKPLRYIFKFRHVFKRFIHGHYFN